MSLLVTDGNAFVHADAYELERKLAAMDPRLYLKYRVIEHPKKPGVKGRRYEVHRHCEDGKTRMIGHWRLEEFDSIWSDMQVMAAGAAGRIAGVEDRIDSANDAIERDNHQQGVDAMGEMMDHAVRLFHDRTQPKNTFRQVGGLKDS